MRSLEKKPQKRPRDMREIATELQKLDATMVVDENSKTRTQTKLWRGQVENYLNRFKSQRAVIAVIAACLALALGGFGYRYWSGGEPAVVVAIELHSNKNELRPGEKLALKSSASLANGKIANNPDNIHWHSSNDSVVAVNSNGEIEAKKNGSADITANVQKVVSAPLTLVVKESADSNDASRLAVAAAVEEHIVTAQKALDRGDYSVALTELAKAKNLDGTNKTVQTEFERTKKACIAEQRIGLTKLKCE